MRKRLLLGVVALGLTIALAWQLHSAARQYQHGAKVYMATAVEAVELPAEAELPEVDFHSLTMVNADVTGWLYSPDMAINYPVVQGQDNSFYLSHLFDGSEGDCGTLFLECRSKDTDRNQVIFGHHMKDGSMFASLLNYQEQDSYEAHPVLYYITPEQRYEVRLFAGFTTKSISSAYNRRFDHSDYGTWLALMQAQSDFQSDVVPTTNDRVLTLSTCAYSFEDARYVVMGTLSPV